MNLPAHDPLLTLAFVLVAGVASGQLAKRFHLPQVTGQILIGIIAGPAVLAMVNLESIHELRPVTHFALGLIAVTVGSHLHINRLRNTARRLLLLILCEATIVPLFVFLVANGLSDEPWHFGFLLAALAISTAPATIVALVQETRSRGVFVKTLVAATALNNIACIALFAMAQTAARISSDPELGHAVIDPLLALLRELMGSALLGGGIGLVLIYSTRRVVRSDHLSTASLLAILVTSALAGWTGLSSMLACLFLGMALANLTPDKDEVGHAVFDDFYSAIAAIFFTLAGMELSFEHIELVAILAGGVFVARAAGKLVAARLAMGWASAPISVRDNLGLAMIPQAGVAVGLLISAQEDPALASIAELLLAVGLTSVTLNEIIGPILTRIALARSGDMGQDRPRVIDFLHEENIITELHADTKEAAIEILVDHALRTTSLTVDRDELLQSVLERERKVSTCVGKGLAIPHGSLPEGDAILGVMGICREGLEFETPDGVPVHCMVLLITPDNHRDRHLEAIAALARVVNADRNLRRQLYSAKSPAHAHVILHADDAEDFNYFLED